MRSVGIVVAFAMSVAPAFAAQKRKQPPAPPPIVRTKVPIVQTVNVAPPPALPEIPSETNSVTHGKWTSSDVGDHTVAYTENESGSVFGILCGTTCVFYLNFHVDCTNRTDYPAMINSSVGSEAIKLRCIHVRHEKEQHQVLAAEPTDNYFAMLKQSGEFGIAVPLANGKFNVSRFSLLGGAKAVATAIAAADERQKQSQSGLRDFTL